MRLRRPALGAAVRVGAALGALCCALASAAPTAALLAPFERPSQLTPRAAGAVLLGLAQAGARLVAVGERGIVLLSDDAGATWRQAAVPVSTTLTAVRFVDERKGWAVGHAGTVLVTSDAGATWLRQLDGTRIAALALAAAQASGDASALKAAQRLVADGADKPWLDLHFFDARRGVVIGAYGLIFGTEDGGANWSPWMDRLDNPKGLHLNSIAAQGQSLLIAGEQGLLLRSDDGAAHFSRLESPYEGSWFSALALGPGRWLIGGLKGRVYSLEGNRFTRAEAPMPVTVTALSRLRDGRVLALNQAGQAQVSADQGRTLKLIAWPPGPPITAVVEPAHGPLVGATLRGPRALPDLKTVP